MKLNFYFLILFFFSLNTAFSQEPLPYLGDFEADDGEWVEYRLGETTEDFYTWEISLGELRHNYPVGGSETTDDWMVSPAFDFSNGGMIESLDYKFSGFGFPFGIDTIALYLVSGSQNPAEADELTLLHLFTDENYNPDNNWYTLEDISIPPTEGSSYIAFRYQTVVNWLDAAFDDLAITGTPLSDNVESNRDDVLHLYPIPARDVLNISSANKIISLKLYDLTGAVVLEELLHENNPKVGLPTLPEGVYIAEITDDKARVSSRRVLIEKSR